MMGGKSSPRLRLRAAIVDLAALGHSQTTVAEKLGTSRLNVRRWVRRFKELRLAGLLTESGRGPKPRSIDWECQIQRLLATSPGEGEERWTQELIASHLGTSVATVNRAFRKMGMVLPGAKFRRNLDARASEVIIGLYLDPPVRALALYSQPVGTTSVGRLTSVVRQLSKRVDELERILTDTPVRDGRTMSFRRFLQAVSQRAAGRKVDLLCHSLGASMVDLVAENGFSRRENESGEGSWVSAGLLGDGRSLGTECGDLRRWIERLLLKHCRRGAGIRRPFIFLFKRIPAGSPPISSRPFVSKT